MRALAGRLLCWFGIHDWGYRTSEYTSHPAPHISRGLARHINRYGAHYQCLRCGIEP